MSRRGPAVEWQQLVGLAEAALTDAVQLAAQLRLLSLAAQRCESMPAAYWTSRVGTVHTLLGCQLELIRAVTDSEEIRTCKT